MSRKNMIAAILAGLILMNNAAAMPAAAEEADTAPAETVTDTAEPELAVIDETPEENTDTDASGITDEASDVAAFVTRLYRYCFDREPDAAGLSNWINQINNGGITAAKVSLSFFNSKEFNDKNLSNTEFVSTLYKVYLDREGSESEISYWAGFADKGVSRAYIIRGFVQSTEFSKICNEYGVTRGSITLTEERDVNPDVTAFVTRLYRYCFDREPDAAGLNNWTRQINKNGVTAAKVSLSFFNSAEFNAKNLSNTEFVSTLYKVYLDREGSETDISYWAGFADKGVSRAYIIRGFVQSTEFSKICNEYGVTRGSITLTEERDVNPDVTAFVTRLYRYCFDREPDAAGLNNWTRQINKNGVTAAKVSLSFFNSVEFNAKNLSNTEFVSTLYRVYLDREGSETDISYWAGFADKGVSRAYIIRGFVQSTEFSKICNKYGVTRGSITLTEARDLYPQISAIVVNAYKPLGTVPDGTVINSWVKKLRIASTGYELVSSVMNSQAYTALNTENDVFANDAYQALLGRTPSAEELEAAIAALNEGKSRTELLLELAEGEEFKNICTTAGIEASSDPYPLATARLNETGWDLKAAYDWSASVPYRREGIPITAETGVKWYADYGFKNKCGNCYVMAAMFCEMARKLGYDAKQISGRVPLRAGGWGPHSWVEITIDGTLYVFDPDFTNETGFNGYMIQYRQPGTWMYVKDVVMAD